MSFTREEIESVAHAAGVAAAKETLRAIGVDTEKPFDMQADFAHLRRWRLLVERSTVFAVMTFVGLVVAAFVAFIGLRK